MESTVFGNARCAVPCLSKLPQCYLWNGSTVDLTDDWSVPWPFLVNDCRALLLCYASPSGNRWCDVLAFVHAGEKTVSSSSTWFLGPDLVTDLSSPAYNPCSTGETLDLVLLFCSRARVCSAEGLSVSRRWSHHVREGHRTFLLLFLVSQPSAALNTTKVSAFATRFIPLAVQPVRNE